MGRSADKKYKWHLAFNRREFFKLAGYFSSIVVPVAGSQLLTGCVANEIPGPALRIGYIPTADAVAMLAGYTQGFFDQENIAVEKPILMSDFASLSKAFLKGEMNLIHLPFPLAISLHFLQKQPFKIVAWNNINGAALTVHKKKGPNRFEDLGGKQIAVSDWYAMENLILQFCLRQLNLEVVFQEPGQKVKDKQINLVLMAGQDMPAALANGAIDGYVVAEPYNAQAEITGCGKILRFTGDIFKNYPASVVVMKEQDLSPPDWALAVVTGLVKAQVWAAENSADVARILSRNGKGYLPVSEEILNRALTKYDIATYGSADGSGAIRHPGWAVSRLGFEPYPYPTATREILKLLQKTAFKNKEEQELLSKLDVSRITDEIVEGKFVVQAVRSAGGIEQFPTVDTQNPYVRKEVIMY